MLIPIILDVSVQFPLPAGPGRSLLSLPCGTGRVLDMLRKAIDEVEHGDIVVVPTMSESDLRESVGGQGVLVIQPEQLHDYLRRYEAFDYLLVIEPRYWPQNGYDFKTVVEDTQYRGASHVVSVGAESTNIRELVECDTSGYIKRVQRHYKPVSWPEAASSAVLYSLVPARAATEIGFRSIAQLRTELAAKGMLSRDWPVESDLLDLSDEQSFLALHERVLNEMAPGPAPTGYTTSGSGVWIAAGSTVHPSTRLVAPVVIQAGASVEDGVTIVGPSLIGPGSRIGRCSVIAQTLVTSGAVVPPESVCRQRVCTGKLPAGLLEEVDNFAGPANVMFADEESEASLASLTKRIRDRRIHFAVKRFLDILLSLVGLILFLPLLVVVAIWIKLDSPGPVFFRHRRERMGGKEFHCLKFRTMAADAHLKQRELYATNEVDGPQFKMRQDPRVTRLGGWLRATNLDELPQLINVLKGDMGLVGPRPSPFRENQVCVPWRMARLSVRPGITGLWQLCRDGGGGGFHEWIYYDILYVRHFSMWLDFKIIVATLLSLGGKYDVPLSWLIPQAEE